MSELCDRLLPPEPEVVAPDGSLVRLLCAVDQASMAHFELGPGEVSRPVVHRTVEEIWFVLDGLGVMWRKHASRPPYEVDLRPQVSLTIPVGTVFQFKNTGRLPLAIVGVTVPPWPGDGEAMPGDGPWVPSVGSY